MKHQLQFASLLLAALPFLFFSCSKEAVAVADSENLSAQSMQTGDLVDTRATYKTYVIAKGKHYANGIHFTPFSGKTLSFSAVFDSSAIYNFTDVHTKYDQNTLYGFADNGASHLDFSARFGWRWFNNQLQIAAYATNNGDSTIVQIGAVPLGVASSYKILVVGNHYDFILNGDTTSLPRASTTASAGNYKLLPYFGGDAVAPQKVTIKIKEN